MTLGRALAITPGVFPSIGNDITFTPSLRWS